MKVFTIAIACEPKTETFHETVKRALDLCKHMAKESYKLYFVHCMAKNKSSSLPYLDNLNKAYNMEIEEQAGKEVREILKELDVMTSEHGIEYEFVEIEKAETVEELLHEFVESFKPDLLYVGMRNQSTSMLNKLVIGSVSQFCVDKLPCPVVVIKSSVL